jgi:hypothetical protein
MSPFNRKKVYGGETFDKSCRSTPLEHLHETQRSQNESTTGDHAMMLGVQEQPMATHGHDG